LQGGLVSGIFAHKTSNPLQAAVLDWDVLDSNEPDTRITRTTHLGRRIQAHIGIQDVEALDALAGSDAEAVLLASQEDP
jgi:hypothetical protein